TDDRVPRPHGGRGLPDGATGLVQDDHHHRRTPDCSDRERGRIVLTGYIMHFVNREYALGTYHTLEGILMMGFGLLLLNSVCSLLNQFCQNPSDQNPEDSFRNAPGTLPSSSQPLPGQAY